MGAASDYLPIHGLSSQQSTRLRHKVLIGLAAALFCLTFIAIWLPAFELPHAFSTTRPLPPHIATAISRCKNLSQKPGPPNDFHDRKYSDRFAADTPPTLLKNAKVWTGMSNGTEVLHTDVLLDKGIIQSVGRVPAHILKKYRDKLVTVDLHNAWVTPGYVFFVLFSRRPHLIRPLNACANERLRYVCIELLICILTLAIHPALS